MSDEYCGYWDKQRSDRLTVGTTMAVCYNCGHPISLPGWVRWCVISDVSCFGDCPFCSDTNSPDLLIAYGMLIESSEIALTRTRNNPSDAYTLIRERSGLSDEEFWDRIHQHQDKISIDDMISYVSDAKFRLKLTVEATAFRLLTKFLTKRQRHSLINKGWFDVKVPSGTRYRLFNTRHNNLAIVDRRGKALKGWCIGMGEHTPIYDNVLSTLISLKADEAQFIAAANELPIKWYMVRTLNNHKTFMKSIFQELKEHPLSDRVRSHLLLPDFWTPVAPSNFTEGLKRQNVLADLWMQKHSLISQITGLVEIASKRIEEVNKKELTSV